MSMKSSLSNFVSNAKLGVKSNSPTILVVLGGVGLLASTVMACKATTKVNDVILENKQDIDTARESLNDEQSIEAGMYTEKECKQALTKAYVKTGVQVAKLYAPSVIVGVLSFGAVLSSNNILRKRNVALGAAYTALDTSFKEYKNRVVNRFGERVNYELTHDIKSVDVTETVVDKNGKEKTVVKEIDVIDPDSEYVNDGYSQFFDLGNPYYNHDASYNRAFLEAQEAILNDKLRANGYVYLIDAYDMTGTTAIIGEELNIIAHEVGWYWDKNKTAEENRISLGIHDIFKPKVKEFLEGYEPTVLLTFNVHGNVQELRKKSLKEKKEFYKKIKKQRLADK